MSERSVRTTTPSMSNFRYVRILNHRRVFAHATPLFFEAGIAKVDTLEISSLSAEPCAGASFCGVAFDIPPDEWHALEKREDEYVLAESLYEPLDAPKGNNNPRGTLVGMLCTRGSDTKLKERGVWPRYMAALETLPATAPRTCWDWAPSSGILPCPTYLRHCLLASRRSDVPDEVRESFLDDTYLCDRATTLRAYLARPGFRDYVESSLPPKELEQDMAAEHKLPSSCSRTRLAPTTPPSNPDRSQNGPPPGSAYRQKAHSQMTPQPEALHTRDVHAPADRLTLSQGGGIPRPRRERLAPVARTRGTSPVPASPEGCVTAATALTPVTPPNPNQGAARAPTLTQR
eukprot:CAMPEP_0206041832 /NCGR_PEP_ID=MMETSP1466-20131121/6194_1 /ASSEMBLY_ACC=CAM_ASM_001126 /TAXON_ID=44452 /ORGANISM="Pavlova gyrans, Strain CCMP608" /LENGTH=345 /DNA_ID=CAMNT_0053416535 /DNA_START=1 /DNA_END=1040 /DNA_ORIENTATION=+